MRDPHTPYNSELCRATYRLRERVREAEARADTAEAELARVKAEIAEERAALTAHIESPEAELTVLKLCQEELRAEVINAAASRHLCEECGGLGHGMTKSLMDNRIKKHCRVHSIDAQTAPFDESQWPTKLGDNWRRSCRSWLTNPAKVEDTMRRQRQRDSAIW